MTNTPTAFLAAHRFGFGLAGTKAPGSTGRDALEHQLAHPEAALIDTPLPTIEANIRTLVQINAATAAAQRQAAMEQPAEMAAPRPAGEAPQPRAPVVNVNTAIILPEFTARLGRALSGEADFLERLVVFWSNHFAVSISKGGPVAAAFGPYERSVIRPGITGRFADLLLAVTRHPAMLFYLDNQGSIGPNSARGRRQNRGINENLAREILELHTLGVDGGYTQADVTSFAMALSGWSFTPQNAAEPGRFLFIPGAHEPGPQTVLGKVYPQEGEAQAEAILADLARHPSTARFIAKKLAAHFVADEPPPALVARLATTYTRTDGDLGAVCRALVASDEAWAPALTKLRSPYEFVVALHRTVGVQVVRNRMFGMLDNLGQPVLRPPSPAGYSDASADWLAPDAIKTRADFAMELAARYNGDAAALARDTLGPALTDETLTAIRRAESSPQGLALLLMSPEFQRR
ncbi:DUF1800 domain-containing protein [Humitalea sp. 24SJ18S-53]|uniref:DUF1800 domain-containing protein n=1 Tax=Humitalea sp. 24SJ18S-53 TaxID=3422307 RepID=UPI003D674B3B